MGFDLFIGIDWSGAKGECHRGIQVAEAENGVTPPQIIPAPDRRGWSRQAVIDHLKRRSRDQTVLAGIDFAFAHPFGDEGYYPGAENTPKDAAALWQMIDAVNQSQDHFYGGGIWHDPQFGPFYNAPLKDGRGRWFASRRRVTETVAAAINGRHPSPTFNCVGPAGVGTGSLAGMRVLHHLKDDAEIWPLDLGRRANLTLAEIFPSLYFSMAGVTDKAKKADPLQGLNTALAWWGSDGVEQIADRLPDQDDSDALVSAAALRYLGTGGLPDIPPQYAAAARLEGWIFGVGWDKHKP